MIRSFLHVVEPPDEVAARDGVWFHL
jgi:hypothetical protein